MKFLKDESNFLITVSGKLVVVFARDFLVIDGDLAFGWFVEAAD